MFCSYCKKGEKKRAILTVRSYENLKGKPDIYVCDKHAWVAIEEQLIVYGTVGVRTIKEEKQT